VTTGTVGYPSDSWVTISRCMHALYYMNLCFTYLLISKTLTYQDFYCNGDWTRNKVYWSHTSMLLYENKALANLPVVEGKNRTMME